MKSIKTISFFLCVLLSSCTKIEGEGGSSTIKGSIWVEDWNATFTVLEAEYSALNEDVYIIYGNHISYDDKTTTNYKGEFEFKYLRQGNYKIYVYSKDKTMQSASGIIGITKDVNISEDGKAINVDKITIYK